MTSVTSNNSHTGIFAYQKPQVTLTVVCCLNINCIACDQQIMIFPSHFYLASSLFLSQFLCQSLFQRRQMGNKPATSLVVSSEIMTIHSLQASYLNQQQTMGSDYSLQVVKTSYSGASHDDDPAERICRTVTSLRSL